MDALAGLPGITPEQLREARARAAVAPAESQDFLVWDENWPSFLFFLSVCTQWEHSVLTMGAPLGGTLSVMRRTGLRYPAVESAARLQRIPRNQWPQLFEDIHTMEVAVLDYDAKQARRE